MFLKSWLSRWTNPTNQPRRTRRARSKSTMLVQSYESRLLLSASPAGSEFQVNTYTTGAQGMIDTPAQSVAIDADGDFVVVWMSDGQDGSSGGIFAQRYNAAGVAQGSEFQVNTFTSGNQRYAAVAMDADGDFVVTWTSYDQDGSSYGIFAQRYNAAGVAQGSEFQVNTYTTSTQNHSSVAMNADGDFVITWTSYDQDGDIYGIFAQRYNAAGVAQGSEFQVNTFTDSAQQHSSVAMDADGDFVVTWTNYGSSYGIFAQRYNAAGVAQGSEFQVNTNTVSIPFRSMVAMDVDGDFVIAWTSDDQDGSGRGIYAQRYNAAGVAQGSEFPVNTYTTGNQRNSGVAMDADGDFVVTWTSQNQDGSSDGIFAQRYNADGVAQGSEFPVNTYTTGSQQPSAVAMDADGDFVIAWTSNGPDGSGTGVFAQRFEESTDTVGPTVTDVLVNGHHLDENGQLLDHPATITVVFSEDLATSGAGSVTDPSNWSLFRDGVEQAGLIESITFGLNMATSKYEALVTFVGTALRTGTYQLVAKETITDVAGNMLDGDTDGAPGGDFTRQFRVSDIVTAGGEFQVNTVTTNAQTFPATAMDADGNFVVTWHSYGQDGSEYGIFAQRYSATGVAQGSEFQVNTYTTGSQQYPAVAMDAGGDFVITWASYDQDGSGYGIFAQRYDSAGVAQGGEFRVNTRASNEQTSPSVAMDADGDFVITWQSFGQDGNKYGVYAQRYNAAGVAQGSEFRVNTTTTLSQLYSSVAMDTDGDFVITWSSENQDGNFFGIFAQRFNAAGVVQGSEFQVNTFTTSNQLHSRVAMDADGEFVIAWDSSSQDGSGGGVYAQRYNAAGIAQGNEFQVHTFTSSNQYYPSMAMDANGDFVIVWLSNTQDGSGYGVYAQRYNSQGIAQDSEFRVNTRTTNQQSFPSVAMDADGDFVITWQSLGQDGSNYGIYAQRYRGNVAPIVDATSPLSIAENSAAGTSVGTVTATDADPTDTLTYSFSGGNVGNAFAINASTGEITVNKPYRLDFETLSSFDLRVAVTDEAGVTRKTTVEVNVSNVNDPPVIADQTFSVAEHSPNGTSVGTVVVTDPDAMDTLTFAFSGGNIQNVFAIDAMTGEITVAKSARLDFATLNAYDLRVAVTDGSGETRKATIHVDVTDANEAPEISPQTFMVDENSPNGTSVGTVVANDPNAMDSLTYAITGGNIGRAFAINATTGEITVNNSLALDFETTPTFSITVQVTDSYGLSRKAVMTINLNDLMELNAGLFSQA
ncbi:hypothetical protein GC163_15225 [bacterium]|nr:hypothetical protein [bacterium]